MLGNDWRLPTSDEWAKIAGKYKYSGSDNANEVAVYGQDKPVQVKTKKPNEYGLYDMSGLVWEWTSTINRSYRVTRGGSWGSDADFCTVSYVGDYWPDHAYSYLGFRPVRTISKNKKKRRKVF